MMGSAATEALWGTWRRRVIDTFHHANTNNDVHWLKVIVEAIVDALTDPTAASVSTQPGETRTIRTPVGAISFESAFL
jgi:hypothetical protein